MRTGLKQGCFDRFGYGVNPVYLPRSGARLGTLWPELSGLAAFWPCQDSGTSLTDSAGSNPMSTVFGTPVYSQTGPDGQRAVGTDATGEGWECASGTFAHFDASTSFSVFVLAKVPSNLTASVRGIMNKRDTSGAGWYLRVAADRCDLLYSDGTLTNLMNTTGDPRGKWVLYVASFNRSTNLARMTMGLISSNTGSISSYGVISKTTDPVGLGIINGVSSAEPGTLFRLAGVVSGTALSEEQVNRILCR